jgi:hypothetical protein
MKGLLICIHLIFYLLVIPLNWKDVINDFGRKFNNLRFSKNVVLIRDDFQNQIFDTTTLITTSLKKNAWSNINLALAKCDYVATKDSSTANCFFIYSDKGYMKFWVKYDSENKISVIKVIKPEVSMHLIPPPCGY